MKEKKSNREREKKWLAAATATLMCAFPTFAIGDTVSISNTVTTSANSGGNASTGGQTIEGKTENSVSVKTVINGEVVEDYSETSDKPIQYKKKVVGEDGVSASASASVGASSLQSPVSNLQSAAHESASEKDMSSGEATDSEVGGQGRTPDEGDAIAAGAGTQASAEARGGFISSNFASVIIAVRSFISNFFSFSWW